MPIINLNRATVATLELAAGKTETLWWDDTLTGFALRIRLDAAEKVQRSYVVQYRFNGQGRKIKLGDVNKLPVDAARKKAEKLFAQILLGTDPAAEKEWARIEAQKLTYAQAVESYLKMKAGELRPSSLKLAQLYLTGAAYFAFKKPLDKVTRADVAVCLDRINNASGAATAGRARAHLSSLFTWCLQRGYCAENPVIQTQTFEGASRDRTLTNDELRAVWNACDMNTDFGKIVRLLVLTGCRRQEIGSLKWSEVDLKAGTITIPGERTKNGRPHVLTLAPAALEIIDSIPRMVDRDYLFGVRGAGFVAWGHARKAFEVDAEGWTLHDIRRTVATQMAEIGIEPHYVEAVLNHASGHKDGVAGTYNRAKYAQQIKTALAMWADHVRAVVTGTKPKLVPLHAVVA
jgi:integrase